ncbi:MAG: hypothetical protein ACPGJS_20465 [Flammeovirgaceae bacterium]
METPAYNEIACKECGANLKFKPGTHHLVCDYCGTENEIAKPASDTPAAIEELDLETALRNFESEPKLKVQTVKCTNCGAMGTFEPNVSSSTCAFCDTPLVLSQAQTTTIHKPQYVLPFKIEERKAIENFNTWISKLWWAPGNLKTYASADKVDGVYIPFWTYDCDTDTSYDGERGDDYTETTTNANGETETETKTRWSSVSGRIRKSFDDILIAATKSLNKKKLNALEPWDLDQLMAYDDRYLSGFTTETYQIDLKAGFEEAKKYMDRKIESAIEDDIGGDHQRIHQKNIRYFNPTFKHILLPVWISAFRYKDKVYQFMVNARTGEVKGERPYSTAKIVLAVIAGIAIIGTLVYLFSK